MRFWVDEEDPGYVVEFDRTKPVPDIAEEATERIIKQFENQI